ncbi:MAG TPA: hypothetical protein VHC22_31590 [Pirellulales bacterium]|nr:hypothetical protein [Pirellulales bacterium]
MSKRARKTLPFPKPTTVLGLGQASDRSAEQLDRNFTAADRTVKPERRGRKIGGETPIFVKLDPVLSVALELSRVSARVSQNLKIFLRRSKRRP